MRQCFVCQVECEDIAPLCPKCFDLHGLGYIALIGIDEEESAKGQMVSSDEVKRTGDYVHLQRDKAKEIFPLHDDALDAPFVFIDSEIMKAFRKAKEKYEQEQNSG